MKALPTQFDNHRLSSAVATPTCSSCCCCCCCLATSIGASSLLAQRIGREGEKHQIPHRHLLTTLSALFVPIVGLLVYMGFWTINSLLTTCTERYYNNRYGYLPDSYTICTNPGSAAIAPLLLIAPFLVLWFLYSRVQIHNPARRALLVTVLIAIAFSLEFVGGAALILFTAGIGGIAYLALVPVIIGWISVWYHRHIGKEVTDPPQKPPAAASSAAAPVPPSSGHEESKAPTPPQQDPPAPSGQ